MATQQEVSRARLAARVGREIDVLVDEVGPDGAIGRSEWDAPDIDGVVHLSCARGIAQGELVRAYVERADEYDLWARCV
jgi:ribosomal protein S12 methylthiotransferase